MVWKGREESEGKVERRVWKGREESREISPRHVRSMGYIGCKGMEGFQHVTCPDTHSPRSYPSQRERERERERERVERERERDLRERES